MASTTASLQLSLFLVALPEKQGLYLPPGVRQAMDMGATLGGGKGSEAMLVATVEAYRAMGWSGPIFALFCDLGRIEWAGALEPIRNRCDRRGVRLVTVKRPQGGLVDRWRHRFEAIAAQPGNDDSGEKIGDAPLWSSSQHRYCTSELKEGQADKALRSHSLVVCAFGIRTEESSNRAQKPGVWVRPGPTTRPSRNRLG